MKVFFLIFFVTLYINVILNLDIDENLTDNNTFNKYDEFEYDNAINNTDYYIQDLTGTATAILEVINEFFLKKNLQFDILLFGDPEEIFYNLITEIGKRISESFLTSVKQHVCAYGDLYLNQSTIIFMKGSFHIDFLQCVGMGNQFRKELKFLTYTDLHHTLFHFSNDYLLSLSDTDREAWKPYLELNSRHMLPFQYFLVDTEDKVKLTTFDWFTETECNSMNYKVINRFDKNSLQWENQLENHEKFKNLHNCMITVDSQSVYSNKYDGKLEAFEYNMMDILAQKLNFIQVRLWRNNGSSITNDVVPAVQLNIDIEPITTLLTEYQFTQFTTTFAEEYILLMITPGELYNSYEKILMPFDELTWYFLIATFGFAFSVIFVVSFMPRKVQDYFYGDGVHLPAYNVAGTFFGIGQMKLPLANFSRMILMVYILFCLIIRTAYQGVMFEMMTKEMRKSSPQTVDDLFERNFNVNLLIFNSGLLPISQSFYNEIDDSQKLKIHGYKYYEFYKDICSIIFDPKQKFAAVVERYSYKMITSLCEKSPELLNQKFMAIPMGLAVIRNHFLLEGIEDMMQHTIQAGIPQYWYKYHQWYLYERNHYSDVIKHEPTVLRLQDLSFGFIIWLIACGVAVLGLLGELLTFAIRNRNKLARIEAEQSRIIEEQQFPLDVQILMEIQEDFANEVEVLENNDENLIQTDAEFDFKSRAVFETKYQKNSMINIDETISTSYISVLDEKAKKCKNLIQTKAEVHQYSDVDALQIKNQVNDTISASNSKNRDEKAEKCMNLTQTKAEVHKTTSVESSLEKRQPNSMTNVDEAIYESKDKSFDKKAEKCKNLIQTKTKVDQRSAIGVSAIKEQTKPTISVEKTKSSLNFTVFDEKADKCKNLVQTKTKAHQTTSVESSLEKRQPNSMTNVDEAIYESKDRKFDKKAEKCKNLIQTKAEIHQEPNIFEKPDT